MSGHAFGEWSSMSKSKGSEGSMLWMYLQERVFLGETKLEHDPIEQDVGILISHYIFKLELPHWCYLFQSPKNT